jgi:hypothetical protein
VRRVRQTDRCGRKSDEAKLTCDKALSSLRESVQHWGAGVISTRRHGVSFQTTRTLGPIVADKDHVSASWFNRTSVSPRVPGDELMDQCSVARHPIGAEGTLTNRSGRDLAPEVDKRFSSQRRSPTGGSVNSVSLAGTYRAEARCSIPISSRRLALGENQYRTRGACNAADLDCSVVTTSSDAAGCPQSPSHPATIVNIATIEASAANRRGTRIAVMDMLPTPCRLRRRYHRLRSSRPW